MADENSIIRHATVPEFRLAVKYAREIVIKHSSSRRRNGKLPAPSIYINPMGRTKDPEGIFRYAGTWGGAQAEEIARHMNAFLFLIGCDSQVYVTDGLYIRGIVVKNRPSPEISEESC
jgi:hypothetical protein